ncbi:hypothetical protein HanRHA438_Chr12g0558401 [Helianthus annuus]|uniref:Uncharacterized protein n=1 Tax=Helianthus annuus TaxID=4232 RepID=A0A251T4S6_HELAN|nr:hypothetical protein HanXRQr2_Chr12g0547061 [Helianthus annuus]KAJ0489809.1 hypothetical protein HanHA300_Chr12g0448201 [Helianthus annuus]KAJ0505723.1 hypothetical protein HanHA89_Chr12g0473711 [Helianthus annuus]KAJ0675392.1 hypothetical protein HanLR1_Chr12g0450651 [Helianthus annuus]KAJ0678687.1 hypothetical protein HanOQP8_Chr12g0450711 [Helianthus annuus]
MKSITLPHPTGDNSTSKKTKRITTEVLQSLTTLWFLCTKQAITASRKLKDNSKISPDSPVIQRPKKLIATISNKAIKMRNRKKKDHKDDGDDGLWQREILMGDKCQPLDFSGVINYDRDGKRTNEFPVRSPRVSSGPAYVAKFDWVPPHER